MMSVKVCRRLFEFILMDVYFMKLTNLFLIISMINTETFPNSCIVLCIVIFRCIIMLVYPNNHTFGLLALKVTYDI